MIVLDFVLFCCTPQILPRIDPDDLPTKNPLVSKDSIIFLTNQHVYFLKV